MFGVLCSRLTSLVCDHDGFYVPGTAGHSVIMISGLCCVLFILRATLVGCY